MAEEEKEKVQPEDEQVAEAEQPEEGEPALTGKELAEQYLAKWQRAQADFANYKKRTEQDKAEIAKFANADLIRSLLPAIDDFERALENIPEDVNSEWVEGIELIYRKLMAVLESQGLSIIEAEGKDFDPNFHQAVSHQEGEEGKVIEELQKGYLLHDRLLRPTMVNVGNGESKQGKNKKTST